MAGSLNRVMLIGRCTADPEMRYLPSGQPVTQLRLATNRYGSSQDGERREFTEYHDVVVWNMGQRKLAELAGQFLHKGSLVYIEGRLQTRSWDDKEGQKRYKTEVNTTDIQFLDSRGAAPEGEDAGPRVQRFPSPGGGEDAPNNPTEVADGDIDPDDIPF
ncbi:MAG TPA: single-stranded DNA-binding protein [Candidatus Dormibacteraeota bacterium]|jgi:single-strand DNA-binding protein|nr:single-stranded DNA-binding protein [Candidatus Dormibacteraeota bacterium]